MFGRNRTVTAASVATIALALAGCMAETEIGSTSAAVSRPLCYGGECIPETTPIYAGQHIEIGTASVVSSGGDLLLTIETTDGWTFDLVHVYAGLDPVPTKKSGAVSPGQFPHHFSYDRATSSTTISIPLPGVACGDTLEIAVHLEAEHDALGAETGWAFGSPFDRGWGWSFTYDICCDGGSGGQCVQETEHWALEPDEWPMWITYMGIGPEHYGKAELIAILGMDPSGDASIRLAQAWIGLKLNWYCGVDVSETDWNTMLTAGSWFYRNQDADGRLPYGVHPLSSAGVEAAGYAQVLEDFNAGLSTVPMCPPGADYQLD